MLLKAKLVLIIWKVLFPKTPHLTTILDKWIVTWPLSTLNLLGWQTQMLWGLHMYVANCAYCSWTWGTMSPPKNIWCLKTLCADQTDVTGASVWPKVHGPWMNCVCDPNVHELYACSPLHAICPIIWNSLSTLGVKTRP